ncbi:MAG: hypothetical protein M0Q13_02955 [Methanothrix sp.]|nr:hypothetical protein [Methanothrix sp.]
MLHSDQFSLTLKNSRHHNQVKLQSADLELKVGERIGRLLAHLSGRATRQSFPRMFSTI